MEVTKYAWDKSVQFWVNTAQKAETLVERQEHAFHALVAVTNWCEQIAEEIKGCLAQKEGPM